MIVSLTIFESEIYDDDDINDESEFLLLYHFRRYNNILCESLALRIIILVVCCFGDHRIFHLMIISS